MERRSFLKQSSAIGAASIGALTMGNSANAASGRDYYELRVYTLDTEQQKSGLAAFLKDAMVPALNRLGVKPVGAFEPREGLGPVYVLLRHKSLEAAVSITQNLLKDDEFLKNGASFLDAPKTDPAYSRVESSFFAAFEGMPQMETPIPADQERVFQLRIYESPSIKTGQTKIEMFNIGEIGVFRETGLHPVFFGEALIGSKMPNLTYMLSFKDEAEQSANWKTFGGSDGWKKLKSIEKYADNKILCNITNLLLKPMDCSQI